MQFRVTQPIMSDALAAVAADVASKSTLPILANVLIDAGERVRLMTTNLKTAYEFWLDADAQQTGQVCINFKDLDELVSNASKNEPLVFELNKRVHITSGKRKYELAYVEADEMPTIPTTTEEPSLLLTPTKLNQLADVSYAAATDDTRPILTGVWLSANPRNGTITAAAADGFRLVVRTIPVEVKERLTL